MTTSITFPNRVKKDLKSVSVTLLGRPPRKTFGKPPLRFGFCKVRGLHGLGSIYINHIFYKKKM